MSTADNSQTTRTKLIQSRAQAAFHSQNPTVRDMQGVQFQQSFLLSRKIGELPFTFQPSGLVQQGCCATCDPPSGTITISFVGEGYDPYYTDLSWNTIPYADTYTISTDYSGVTFSLVTSTSARANYADYYGNDIVFTITATNSCGSTQSNTTIQFPCFLAGSLVTLADGREVPIEDIQVGDVVVGAFGEHNPVLALHRPLLGSAKMVKINNEHTTSAHHPHIAANKSFYCADPARVYSSTYGREHEVLNAEGQVELRMLYGLAAGRVQQLTSGVALKTIDGSREVNAIDELDLPSDTQLYNLVVGGSHTYHVEGYAVTGWPREDDFDYDNWTPK